MGVEDAVKEYERIARAPFAPGDGSGQVLSPESVDFGEAIFKRLS
jgi:hypothetical protein